MKTGKELRKLFPGSVAFSFLLLVLGLIMVLIPLTPGIGGNIALFLTGLGSARFLAGFLGFIYVAILAEEFRRMSDQPFNQMVFLSKIQNSGLLDIFRNRLEGTAEMIRSLEDENKQFTIVGSSLRGLVGVAFDEETEYSEIWKAIKDALQRKVQVNILLTHPEAAHHRAIAEGRLEGDIETDILENLIYLVMYKMENPKLAEYLSVKLYSGTPTIFMICTSQKMLLNPYPYYATAASSYAFLVDGGSPLYTYYYHSHYRAAWLDSRSTIDIKEDPKEAVKQIQELINMNSRDKNGLIVPDETKRNAMLQTLYTMLQN